MTATTEKIRRQAVVVVECDIPAGMTIREYHASRAASGPARRSPRRRLQAVLRRAA